MQWLYMNERDAFINTVLGRHLLCRHQCLILCLVDVSCAGISAQYCAGLVYCETFGAILVSSERCAHFRMKLTCLHAYIHTYIHMHVCICVCICVCTCTGKNERGEPAAQVYTYLHIYIYIKTHVYIPKSYIYIYIYIYIICTYIHTHTQIHAYLQNEESQRPKSRAVSSRPTTSTRPASARKGHRTTDGHDSSAARYVYACVCVYIYIYICLCVCVCVCV